MIFPPAQARAIAGKRKTQARIPATGPRCRFRLGHDYAVQTGPGRPAACRLKIVGIGRQPLGALTLPDARAEGHRTTADFMVAWVRRYDRAWVEREKVDLAAVFDDDVSVVDWILVARFEQRHAQRIVWVLHVELLSDAPRYLARQGDILAGGPQYTANRARAMDDVEAVPARWLDREAARRAEHGARMRAGLRASVEAERQRRRNLRVAA